MEDAAKIPTMSVAEATETLRGLGLKISPETLRKGIEQKQFRFGNCIRTKSNNPVYIIYKKLLDQWISERTVQEEGGDPA